MSTASYPVLKAFTYDGRDVAPGDMVTMPPIDAAIHGRKGHISLTRGAIATRALTAERADVPAEEAPVLIETPRRRYRRRDLTAEGTE